MFKQFEEEDLKLPVPESVYKYSHEIQKLIYEYLSGLQEIDRKAYIIAYKHLGTSFNIVKSVGYTEWLKSNSKKT